MRYMIILAALLCLFACQTTGSGQGKYAAMQEVPQAETALMNHTGSYMECSLHAFAAARQVRPPEQSADHAASICADRLDAYRDYLAGEMNPDFAHRQAEGLKEYTRARLLELSEPR